jgi:hypothetical protein
MSVDCDNFKRFLDEIADNLANLKASEVAELYENMFESIAEQDNAVVIEDIFAFCSASVMDMIQSARGTLEKIFRRRNELGIYSNFHVLISSVVSTIVKSPIADFDPKWIDLLLEAVITGLTAIESETISLSGSSLIKLLKWDEESHFAVGLSQKLAAHSDFVAILTADMCAMFSRIDEVDSAPFLRIVRFCELLIDVSDKQSGLTDKIVETVAEEFIAKVYRTTLRTSSNVNTALKWSNDLLKVCHRGNELVRPLVGEVFTHLNNVNVSDFVSNSDFIEILSNARSRAVPEIVCFLFTSESSDIGKITLDNIEICEISEEVYKRELLNQLESLECFKIAHFDRFKSVKTVAVGLFQSHHSILLNWLPYVMKVAEIETSDPLLKLQIDISKKLAQLLDL